MGGREAGLATACAVVLVVGVSAFTGSSASGQSTAALPLTQVSSNQVPAEGTPPPVVTGPAELSVIERPIPNFGRLAARQGVGVRTYAYSPVPGSASMLDVYTPRSHVGREDRNERTVILVHGGGWQAGAPTDLESQAVQLARQLGVVVVAVTYRLATEAPWPAQRDDVNAAVTFVREHAAQLNVDNSRTVILGSSAGGQVAASVATDGAGKERFRGLVTLSGLVSPLYMAEKNPGYSNAVIPNMLLRCLPAECPDLYRSATAVTSLDPEDPPSLLFHSKRERSWDPTQAREFVQASHAVGVPSTLVVLNGGAHGIDSWPKIWPTLRTWLGGRLGESDRRR